MVVKAGRFGEYVTDGEYNATLRKDDTVEAITLERAAELLAERRAKGPAKKAAKKGAKKAPAKKTPGRQEGGDQEDRRRRRSPTRPDGDDAVLGRRSRSHELLAASRSTLDRSGTLRCDRVRRSSVPRRTRYQELGRRRRPRSGRPSD